MKHTAWSAVKLLLTLCERAANLKAVQYAVCQTLRVAKRHMNTGILASDCS